MDKQSEAKEAVTERPDPCFICGAECLDHPEREDGYRSCPDGNGLFHRGVIDQMMGSGG